jgi:molecular chaperone DnaK (HSP70)
MDWGNSNTVVAFATGKKQHLVHDSGDPEDGTFDLIPSFSSYDGEGHLLAIGKPAKEALGQPGQYVVSGVKRLIGAKYSREGVELAKRYGLEIHDLDGDGTIYIAIGEKFKRPEEVAVEFFARSKELLEKQAAERTGIFERLAHGKFDARMCAITCPVHYDDPQRTQLKKCVEEAGFTLVDGRLFAEPVAATLLLPAEELERSGGTLFIDWGGGTLDFAVVGRDGEPKYVKACKVEAGGIDMDLSIIEGLQGEGRVPAQLDPIDFAAVRHWVESAKEKLLSMPEQASVAERIQNDLELPDTGRSLPLLVSLQEVRNWIAPVIQRGLSGIDHAVRQTKGTWGRAVLVGGPTCSPYIARQIQNLLKGRTDGSPPTGPARILRGRFKTC